MLDRATIERLSEAPEQNAPMLNVALAEEGHAKVLLALARCPAVLPEALSVVGRRAEEEGADVGRDPEVKPEDPWESVLDPLDQLLMVHPNAPGVVRDTVLSRHPSDPFFVLAGSAHPAATLFAIERGVDWPACSPMHDRRWLALVDPNNVPPLTIEEWADDPSALRREAAALFTRAPETLARLARDTDRRVRRAVASNPHAPSARTELAISDPAAEVRSRAQKPLSSHEPPAEAARFTESARFAAALREMESQGILSPDVHRTLLTSAAEIDEEGAMWAARVLPKEEVLALVEQAMTLGATRAITGLGAGFALRAPLPGTGVEDAADTDLASLTYDLLKGINRWTGAGALTGKARLAVWSTAGILGCPSLDAEALLRPCAESVAGDRMVLGRAATQRRDLVREMARAAKSGAVVPGSLLELAWRDKDVDDETVFDLATRLGKAKARQAELPEDEVDFDPELRSLDVLERVVLATTLKQPVAPRAALAVIALDARRVRYVLAAMPQWKGRLSGAKLGRVLRQHAGALSAAQAENRHRASKVEGWTERLMSELEVSVALAVGHVTAAEVARRIESGRQHVDDGLSLFAGVEARAALEGVPSVTPILEWATRHRISSPPALALWLLLEKLDREKKRASSLIASALDGLATSKAGVPSSVCDALAVLEQRSPGRLVDVSPQSPRGRATLVSGIARAHRALGGMRDERGEA